MYFDSNHFFSTLGIKIILGKNISNNNHIEFIQWNFSFNKEYNYGK